MALLVLPFVFSTALADTPLLIEASDAAALKAAVGSRITVHGRVSKAAWSDSGKVMTIEFENAPKFSAAVFEKGRAKMDEAFLGDLAGTLTGAEVRLVGDVEPYGGHVEALKEGWQVLLTNSSQITIVTPNKKPTS